MTVSNDITRDYYATTASRSHVASRAHYEAGTPGLLARMGKWLPTDRDTMCLDVGCGCGELVYALESAGFRHVVGVDLCHQELVEGRAFVKGELVEANALDHLASLPAKSVGLITAFNFLEHLPKNEVPGFLGAATRVLAPGGSIVLMVPNALSPFGASTRYWDITHEWAFTPNNFRQLVSLTELSPDIDFRECGPIPHGPVSYVRYGLWQMIRAGIATWFLIEVGNPRGWIYTMDMLVRMRRR